MKTILFWAISNLAWSLLVYVIVYVCKRLGWDIVAALIIVVAGLAAMAYVLVATVDPGVKIWGCLAVAFLTLTTIDFNISIVSEQKWFHNIRCVVSLAFFASIVLAPILIPLVAFMLTHLQK